MSVFLRGVPPPPDTIKFFDRLIPGIWQNWVANVEAGLVQVDAHSGGQTTITSWWRSPNKNRAVGGHADSQHLVGLAFDVVPGKGTSLLAISEAADIFRRLGFTVDPAETHVHVQTFPPGILRRVGILDALKV